MNKSPESVLSVLGQVKLTRVESLVLCSLEQCKKINQRGEIFENYIEKSRSLQQSCLYFAEIFVCLFVFYSKHSDGLFQIRIAIFITNKHLGEFLHQTIQLLRDGQANKRTNEGENK